MKKIVVAALGLAAVLLVMNSGSAEASCLTPGYGYGAGYGGYVGVGLAPRYNYPAGYGAYYGSGCNTCAPRYPVPRCGVPVAPCAPRCVTPAYYPPRGCAPVTPGCRSCGFGY